MKIDNGIIRTQIGNVAFEVHASDGEISNASIDIAEIEPLLPQGMEVEGSIGILLTLVSPSEIKDLQFSCEWRDNEAKGGACSGEGLDAWEWESEGQLIVIGTEDGEWLFSRLNLGELTRDNYPVSMDANRITIKLDKYPANTELTLHFVVSNNSLPEKEDCSCWYAVDVAHKRVVEACR
ncbi:MAG: hypothetical protein AB2563_16555 [Candidatus Thiodiazotropha endolucinida]